MGNWRGDWRRHGEDDDAMRRVIVSIALLLVLGAWQIPKATLTYDGPIDVVPNPALVWSLQAMDGAYAASGGKLFRLRRASDSAEQDINAVSTGGPDTAAVATFCAATDCFAAKVYEQTGNLYCQSATVVCDFVQATTTKQPQYIASCQNSLPCLRFVRLSSQHLQFSVAYGGGPTLDISWALVVARTGDFTTLQRVVLPNATGRIAFQTSANIEYRNNAIAPEVICAASNTTFHSFIAVDDDPNPCICNVDGTEDTGACGGAPPVSGVAWTLGANSTGTLEGDWTWLSMHPTIWDSTTRAAMRTALQTIWALP